jgi:hypothetical protein
MAVEKRKESVDFSDKEKDNINTESEQNKDNIVIAVEPLVSHKRNALKFDSGKISDLKYLEDIFSSDYDKFHSLDFLKKIHAELLSQGYPQTPALNEYLFWTTISRRMQIIYQENHKKEMGELEEGESLKGIEDLKFLDSLQSVAEHVTALQKVIDVSLETAKQVKDVVDLHKETCERAEKFLAAHFGEYVKRHSASGKITDIIDKAYWAFIQDVIYKEDGIENVDYVWSEELKFLIDKKIIPVEIMAFILRTSIESLYNTAKIRKDEMIEIDKEKAEKNLKELMLEFELLRDAKDREILEK